MTPKRLLWVIVVAIALLGAGCSGTSTDTTVAADPGNVVFGSGAIPETVPEDFPIPDAATIGTTLVDRNRDFTQVVLRARTSLSEVVSYFEQNLAARSYEIVRSESGGIGWEIDFARDGAAGLIMIEEPAPNISQMVIEFGGDDG